ncbi:MAG: helicase-related protein, partial [Alphaproteobacteria bacterium]|nr:helicase-related protein [Alphaproteobacteria bacterium]
WESFTPQGIHHVEVPPGDRAMWGFDVTLGRRGRHFVRAGQDCGLAVAVVDEQHRFGVHQRMTLAAKGKGVDVLVMTATPIPRTLALTLYGDLDLSVIDQLPPGRQEIKTKWLKPEQRASAYAFVRRQATEGHQSFIICPLVEESETIQARAAVAEFERLSEEVFPDLKLGLLHGRLSATDKNKVMRRFHAGELDIIVAT